MTVPATVDDLLAWLETTGYTEVGRQHEHAMWRVDWTHFTSGPRTVSDWHDRLIDACHDIVRKVVSDAE